MNHFRKGLLVFCSCLNFLDLRGFSSPMAFYLECPPNVTVSCDQDLSNLDKWGTAYIWEHYRRRPAPPPISVISNTNACGIGSITRTWQVEDAYWRYHTCSQIITVTGGSSPFSAADITWPLHLTLESCKPSADPKNLSPEYAYPRFNRKKCSQPLYSYKDQRFTVSDGCAKILREWKVIDWCQYKPNVYPVVGLWTYTQVIKLVVNDSTARIICPRDSVFLAQKDCKSAFVSLDSARGFSQCGNILKIRNTSPYARTGGPDASGEYPVGVTEFFFIAEYACGKEIKCKMRVTVRNNIPPTSYCLNGLIVALMGVDHNKDGTFDDGMAEIWAKDLDRGSFHTCGFKPLRYSFSKDTNDKGRVFTCKDLGRNDVEVWVTDPSGNQSFCKTFIEVQNNNARIPNCKRDSIQTNPPASISLSGQIEDNLNNPTAAVHLRLSDFDHFEVVTRRDIRIVHRIDTVVGASGNTYFVHRSDTILSSRHDTVRSVKQLEAYSFPDGSYRFKDLKAARRYGLKLEKREKDLSGIGVEDVIALLRHVLRTERITDSYRLIAADVNSDYQVTIEDFNLLYDVWSGRKNIDAIPLHWKFIPKLHAFVDPLNPFHPPWPDSMEFVCPDKEIPPANFVAIRVGELDGKSTAGKLNSRGKDDYSLGQGLWHRIFPNPPDGDYICIDFVQLRKGDVEFTAYDLLGKKLWFEKTAFDQGLQRWELKFPRHTAPAILLYTIEASGLRSQGKLELFR